MTAHELIILLTKQADPDDIVCIETMRGSMPIDDDWARCHFYRDGERHRGFVLLAYDETDEPRIKAQAQGVADADGIRTRNKEVAK